MPSQHGILNRPPDHLLLAALNLLPTDHAAARGAVERLRALVHRELRSQLDATTPDTPKDQPSAETGELGFMSGYDRYHLTITIGFGLAAYTKLGVTGVPADLRDIPWAQLDDAPLVPNQADLMLQICTDSMFIAEHVVRRISEELADVISIVWVLPGSQRHTSRRGRTSREDGRALIGFLDGTSNLHPRDSLDDRRLVFVDPADRADLPPKIPVLPAGQPNPYNQGPQPPTFPEDLHDVPGEEPAWTKDGTYMVVRASVVDMHTWDTQTILAQEEAIGRRKVTGNPLTTAPDVEQRPIPDPDFATDAATPQSSHIRKANPRGPGDDLRRIFRRGYPLILPTDHGLDLGLAFICFARTITTQFEFITRGWLVNENFPEPQAGKDRLRSFERGVLAGGYYFVPPLEKASQPWSWVVPPEAAS